MNNDKSNYLNVNLQFLKLTQLLSGWFLFGFQAKKIRLEIYVIFMPL